MTEYSVDDSRMFPMNSSACSAVLTMVLSNSLVAMATYSLEDKMGRC